jgi:hypothetical protein
VPGWAATLDVPGATRKARVARRSGAARRARAGGSCLLVVLGSLLAFPDRSFGFTPTDPLASGQWYLSAIHAFDAWPVLPANLLPVRVGVIDSGIDGGHPEFAGRIVAARSFVGGSALVDSAGHGTFVAGEIAAAVDNGEGIAGIAPAAQLVIAKVVGADGSVSLTAEAAAIRWAVDQGARVINLSLGGVRDPKDPGTDTYSDEEAAAVRYAVAHGVVLVAAVGNGDQSPSQPWPYASYPAALAHVIGVSALNKDGSVPTYSNRDAVFNDLAAPGSGILSTFPRALTAVRPACPDQGYSDCGPDEYAYAEGTSFAAPQVAAAAVDLLGLDPQLQPDQVSWLLERTADDVNAATGCAECPVGRDALTGWGRLDIAAAIRALLAGQFPPADRYEPNNDAGGQAYTLWGSQSRIRATVDYWDNPTDVYRVHLQTNQLIAISLTGTATTDLEFWQPQTRTLKGPHVDRARNLAARSTLPTASKHLAYRARQAGWYYIAINATAPGFAAYTLQFTKTRAAGVSSTQGLPKAA